MRLAAQIKGGFYPAPPEAVAEVAKVFRVPPGQSWCMLDPCCGKGAALSQLAEVLSCPASNVYGIELGDQRAIEAKAALPEANVLGPASFFGVQISVKSFSLVWCNPPFDDELGGGRVEHDFLKRATNLLVPGGVMCFVAPEDVVEQWQTTHFFKAHFTQYLKVPFPAGVRKYEEMVLLGERRKTPLDPAKVRWESEENRFGGFTLPESRRPRSFEKIDLTDDEYLEAMQRSPLRDFLEPPAEQKMPEPPMSLSKGHIALLLAAGHLDGVVRPEGEMPHVVRGVAQKVEYTSNVEESENDKGQVTTKTTISQKILMTVRAVAADGTLKTFAQE